MEQIYCSVGEIIEDLGDSSMAEAKIYSKIVAASQELAREIGRFLPIKASVSLPSLESEMVELDDEDALLQTPPLLSVSSVSVYGVARPSGDYKAWPYTRYWLNGPYSALQLDDMSGTLGQWAEEAGRNVIVGNWGLYDETVSLGITASQLIGDTTLVVTNGSKVSAGMVLLIESEWELVASTGATTASGATLSATIDDAAEEIGVSNGTLVSVGEEIKIDFERMRVLDVAGNTLLVARGVSGSKRASHTISTAVSVYRTFTVSRGVNGSSAAAHSGAAILRQVAPADINYLCRQVAALMIRKAATGYVGQAGNNELGQAFFVNEFPRNQIEHVKNNYPWMGL